MSATTSYAQALNSRPSVVSSQRSEVGGQKPVTVDAEFLKAAQIAIAERDKFKAVSEAQAEALTAKDQQIAALRALLQIQESISTSWKNAATERKDAIQTDDKLIKFYDQRIIQLQDERDSARRSRSTWAVGGLVLGAALALFATKRQL